MSKIRITVAAAATTLALTSGGTMVRASEPFYGAAREHGDWSGLYMGGHVGGAATLSDWMNLTPGGDVFKFSAQGFSGGAHVGFNLQRANLVFGIEADYTALELSDKVASPSRATVSYTNTISGIFTVGPRIGVALGPTLAYLKGGYALANARWRGVESGTPEVATDSQNLNGWFVGGGLSMLVAPNMALGLEYNFHRFESVDLAGLSDLGTPYRVSGYQNDLHTVMARLSFKFGHDRGPPAYREPLK